MGRPSLIQNRIIKLYDSKIVVAIMIDLWRKL